MPPTLTHSCPPILSPTRGHFMAHQRPRLSRMASLDTRKCLGDPEGVHAPPCPGCPLSVGSESLLSQGRATHPTSGTTLLCDPGHRCSVLGPWGLGLGIGAARLCTCALTHVPTHTQAHAHQHQGTAEPGLQGGAARFPRGLPRLAALTWSLFLQASLEQQPPHGAPRESHPTLTDSAHLESLSFAHPSNHPASSLLFKCTRFLGPQGLCTSRAQLCIFPVVGPGLLKPWCL